MDKETKKELELETEVSNEENLEVEEANDDVEVDEVMQLQQKISELEDTNLRLLAEFNNYKKRSSEEFNKAQIQGKVEVFKKLVDVIDNFERALNQDCQDEEFKKGVEMIYTKLMDDASSLGLEEVDASGLLDPNLHHALMVEENDDLEDNQIIEVLQKGYKVEDILIRPSMVKVNQKSKN